MPTDDPRKPRLISPHHLARVRALDEPHFFHEGLTDEERLNIERQAFQTFHLTGSRMRIPPSLFEDLRNAGVSMEYFDADEALEGFNPNI